MSTSHATLSAAADDRKSRLAKLKNLKRKQPADEIAPPESERSASPPSSAVAAEQAQEPELTDATTRLHLSGRNYDAETKGPKLGFEAPPTLGMEGPTLEEQAAEVEAEIKRKAAEEANDDKGVDLFKLQPKKPNWDLKRDLDKKLEVLNTRTDNAIAKLVRERIGNAQAAARKTAKPVENGDDERSGEATGMDGVALVEGVRVREREEEEDERREREDEDLA
ncbi:cwf18 pre-mRNA splicing factor-domain-containing protein [Hypoxylon rubiginosum]|uniref:Cwf18 pre-mRNA splicing factor-domain-containing protein n=1 Tax=Hypoxylon rubiginosum TaxID=110542 RepID=A0ACB9YJM9_9PEZI|nr:cwf18 pre-mRNA splicing factor-domain-containing protein [Hypoxylon rubiginosum]